MKIARVLLTVLPLVGLAACSGGGGGTGLPPVAAWEKFRHDPGNSGQGNGFITSNNGVIKWQTQIDQTPISSSPAIDINGVIYVATEGGTLAALDPTSGSIKWSVCSCDAPGSGTPLSCPAGTPSSLGTLISSPAIYAFNSATNIYIGSASGKVYMFQDNGTVRTCAATFEPNPSDFGTDATIASRFISSPTFTTNPTTAAVSGIFIGAAVDVTQAGATRTVGKLYAMNSDGTLIWQFPTAGTGEIGAVTSSPAIGAANALFFTAADGNLYGLSNAGAFKWRFPIGATASPLVSFVASPATFNLVFAASANGQIYAINPDGSFRWEVSSPDGAGFVASLAVGVQATPTITATTTPTPPPTPTAPPGATRTPTATATPVLNFTTVFGITTAGNVVVIDETTGEMKMLSLPVGPIAGPVVSSPLLSADSYLVVGGADGTLHAINTSSGEQPSGWPVTLQLGIPIRSSPSIDNNGVVYVGTDNGMVYAVGTQ
jgi:outer membrane protein assembly factor BamB